jgi:hypothetical protein
VIYANIFKLYTDKVYGKILMSCEDVYQKRRTLEKQVTCKKVLFNGEKGEIGGYAYANSVELLDSMIVLCDPFFRDGQELLLPLITRLRSNKAYQKDPHQMNGKTRALLDEITHLAAMSETDDSKRLLAPPTVIHVTNRESVVVRDQPLRTEAINPTPIYGPENVQRMGIHTRFEVRNRSQYNGTWSCCLEHAG